MGRREMLEQVDAEGLVVWTVRRRGVCDSAAVAGVGREGSFSDLYGKAWKEQEIASASARAARALASRLLRRPQFMR